MKTTPLLPSLIALGILLLAANPAAAQQHTATRLGNPETRFADPLQTREDLRSLFASAKHKPDIAAILHDWGWDGDLDDLFAAAANAEIREIALPVGARMPFMASRENGKPVLLKDVLWAGKGPVSAYAFTFSSKGKRYRCVTPRACANFYLEDIGSPMLAFDCDAPAEGLAGRPVQVCFTLTNRGDAAEKGIVVTLPVPGGAEYVKPGEEAMPAARQLVWEIASLGPGGSAKFCAFFVQRQPGSMSFSPSARGEISEPVAISCFTRIAGVPAVLIEVVDLEDPVEVGKEVTYVIKVTNQGTAPGTNIRLVCALPEGQEFASGSGASLLLPQARVVATESLASLAPKGEAVWRVTVRATQRGDARFKVELSSDQFQQPITEWESTQQY